MMNIRLKQRISHKFHKIISKLRTRRRMIIILAVSLLFIVIIGGLLWSHQAWDSYQKDHIRRFDSVKIDIDKVILQTSSKSNAKLSNTDKLSNIIKLQNKLKGEIKSYCEVNPLIKWQDFIGQYSDKIKSCEQKKSNLNKLIDKLSIITNYLSAEHELTTIIDNVNQKTNKNNQPDKWESIEAFWQQAERDISKLSDVTEFKTIKELASSKVIKIKEAWGQLSDASKAKNRQNFEEARSNLTKSYTSLAEISKGSKTELGKLITDFTISYRNTFI